MYPHNPIAILLLFVVVVLLFGSQKIPELMRSIGQGKREFEKGLRGEQDAELRKDQDREAEIRRRVEEEMRREDEKRHASK
jgi:sec-independent protein translocase protein TatA